MLTAEAASLRFQHRLFHRELGTLFPSTLPLCSISHVLDLSCGPGAWLLEVVQAYPHIHGVGVDQKPELVQSAREDAHLVDATTASFHVVERYEQLPYADNSFDFVHVQCSSASITPKQWPEVLQELARILRPGGWLHFLDFEIGPTSSDAVNTFIHYLHVSHSKEERVLSSKSQALTSAIVLPRLLREAGYSEVNYTLYAIDIGNQAGNPGKDYILAVLAQDTHVARHLVKAGVVTEQEINSLTTAMYHDAQRLKYCATGMLISVIGKKLEGRL